MTWKSVALLAVGVVCGLGPQRATAECISVTRENPVAYLRVSDAVYLARVESISANSSWPIAEVRVIRSWKGDADRYTWSGATVAVGEHYLVFSLPGWTSFDAECSYLPIPMEQAVPAIRMLDRFRGFPRLVLPKVKKPS
jgi:hypothetical protein